ncbi:DUF6587 family protein [Dokdonella koreensis]|uniref:Uncharacterized protein n=1 Tax=Dokdonella koreensis DS-123 TaxID=1300342 RepID=A0A160DTW4_9GAMM|nr:DUF6587 family protein [Dokdonella koreensis]ANB17835.1 Hypothetical protein I596_1812 [Dokdonella koreensis DS-123]
MSAALELALVVLIVGWAAIAALRRLAPRTARRWQAGIADRIDRPGRPAWLRRCGRVLRPLAASGGSCGDGCGSCGSCGPAPAGPQPLVFHPRRPPAPRPPGGGR